MSEWFRARETGSPSGRKWNSETRTHFYGNPSASRQQVVGEPSHHCAPDEVMSGDEGDHGFWGNSYSRFEGDAAYEGVFRVPLCVWRCFRTWFG